MKISFALLKTGTATSVGMLLGAGLLTAGYLLGVSSMTVFSLLFATVVTVAPPRNLVSPLSMIHGYYFVWFLLAPAFSELHSEDNFASHAHYVAYGMIFLTHVTAVFGARSGDKGAYRDWKPAPEQAPAYQARRDFALRWITLFLYVASTSLVVAIVLSSGGFAYWAEAPGDAFLNRQGSGVYVVLSHFTTFCLAALVGYRAYTSRRKLPLILFISWLVLTAPVHGSKGLISLFLILSLTPWLRNLKFAGASSLIFVAALIFIFFFGLYLRNISWITPEEAIPYALNYFTTLRNLILLLDDFKPDFLLTFFLPFKKFLTPFGLTDPSLYFDMNHLLTDKYFPTAWEIRATEQWPVEADLYLNFYFIFGLPLVFLYTYIIGRVYGQARITNNLGSWIVAMLLIVSIVSHLRGSIINHLDFYLYPMFFVIYALFRRRSFSDRTQ
jgi:hypothetical protein